MTVTLPDPLLYDCEICSIIMTVRHLYDCDVLCGGNTGMILLLSFKFDL